jgi:hypothetical protein
MEPQGQYEYRIVLVRYDGEAEDIDFKKDNQAATRMLRKAMFNQDYTSGQVVRSDGFVVLSFKATGK